MHRYWSWLLAALLGAGTSHAVDLSRKDALEAIEQPAAAARLAGVERLAEVGRMTDADRLVRRLGDTDTRVRSSAGTALWRIWSRSGDPAIDKLFAHGVVQMQASKYAEALATFNDIVSRKPAFAEGWNKRATLYFLLGENAKSLHDCDEVLKRNPQHFGALSGAGQIHLKLGNLALALEFFRRALTVNPNLEGLAEMIPVLEQRLREQDRNTT